MPGGCEVGERCTGIWDNDLRECGGMRVWRCGFGDDRDRAASDRVRDKFGAIHLDTANGDEHRSRRHPARIGGDGRDFDVMRVVCLVLRKRAEESGKFHPKKCERGWKGEKATSPPRQTEPICPPKDAAGEANKNEQENYPATTAAATAPKAKA